MIVNPLSASMETAASGLSAQSTRMRVVSENLANAASTSNIPGGDPYTRKTISFGSIFDNEKNVNKVEISDIGRDKAPFRLEFDPGHPAADGNGYVKLPNVNMLVEMADMREANRSYEANLQMLKQAREMISMTIDLLRT